MLQVLFFTSVFLLYLIYHGYGLLLRFLAVFMGNEPVFNANGELPFVTVLLTVYNEEAKIEKRLLNLLDTDYPTDRLQILVASDGSTDRTHEIVEKSAAGAPIELFVAHGRLGKTGTQNRAVSLCKGEVIVFTDADTEFTSGTLRALVGPFQSATIGATTGQVIFRKIEDQLSEAQTTYWDYELLIRDRESRLGILAVSAGPCMAVRKAILQPMPEFVGEDCVIPLQVVLQGSKMLHCKNALAYDSMESSPQRELRTRVRMTLRNWEGTLYYSKLLNPLRHPGYAFSLYFHKILRWLSPVFLIVATCSLIGLASDSIYALLLLSLVFFYMGGIIGWAGTLHNRRIPVASTIFAFLLANYGFLLGLIKFLQRRRIVAYQAGV